MLKNEKYFQKWLCQRERAKLMNNDIQARNAKNCKIEEIRPRHWAKERRVVEIVGSGKKQKSKKNYQKFPNHCPKLSKFVHSLRLHCCCCLPFCSSSTWRMSLPNALPVVIISCRRASLALTASTCLVGSSWAAVRTWNIFEIILNLFYLKKNCLNFT